MGYLFKEKKFLIVLIRIKYPPPKDVVNMQGIWEFDLSTSFQTDSTAYTLYIQNGLMDIGETISDGYPYYFHTTLVGAILRCKKAQTWLWEVPLEDPSVVANRAIIIIGLNFTIESLNFECSAWLGPKWKNRTN